MRLSRRFNGVSVVGCGLQFGVVSQRRRQLDARNVRLIVLPVRHVSLIVFQAGLRESIVLQHRVDLIVAVRRAVQIVLQGAARFVAEPAFSHLRAVTSYRER